ncbi:hypothetical protein GCM10010988_05710 [Cnuibacter physcomitrellae]|uniref:Uncharacterized protein n=1 Tax=Cnuibacter physcomitrellae TaxID=1619308 RepID=A0A1X9LJY1_9MICO|nr:hypothetical protein [Cnuibacter physcomitrellae]ARJ05483.1 hypothetical protein B5808_09795 [Cnuibacter physcomitrellae]GGI35789.1 hypothetical protein GCM10010988_05710 [Cnuibacter physcomitrellae]
MTKGTRPKVIALLDSEHWGIGVTLEADPSSGAQIVISPMDRWELGTADYAKRIEELRSLLKDARAQISDYLLKHPEVAE